MIFSPPFAAHVYDREKRWKHLFMKTPLLASWANISEDKSWRIIIPKLLHTKKSVIVYFFFLKLAYHANVKQQQHNAQSW